MEKLHFSVYLSYLGGDQVLWGENLVLLDEVFSHRHLFLPNGEEQRRVLQTEQADQLNLLTERGGCQRDEGWEAQEHRHGYEIDAVAEDNQREKGVISWKKRHQTFTDSAK